MVNISKSKIEAITQLNKSFQISIGGSIGLLIGGFIERKVNDIDIVVPSHIFNKLKDFVFDYCKILDDRKYDFSNHIIFEYMNEKFCLFLSNEPFHKTIYLNSFEIRISNPLEAIQAKKRYVEELKNKTSSKALETTLKHQSDIDSYYKNITKNGK